METAPMISSIMSGSLILATPPWARMSAGTRSSAITAAAPASSAIFACSEVSTSMITPPFSISARPALTVNVASSRAIRCWSLIGAECTPTGSLPRMAEAVFEARGDGRFVATELARGPWDAGAQHGGAPAALLMRAFERLPAEDSLLVARVTYELLRPAPLGELDVEARVARPGRRVRLLEGAIRSAEGTEVVRARALQVRPADAAGLETDPPPPGPERGRAHRPGEPGFSPPYSPMFTPDAIEVRLVSGGFGNGRATAWLRRRAP